MSNTIITPRSSLGRRSMLASTVAAAALAKPAIAQRAHVLRYGSMLPANSIYHRACVMFGDELAKLSSGNAKSKCILTRSSALRFRRCCRRFADRIAANHHGGIGVVFEIHEAARCLHALPYIVPSADQLKAALNGPLGQRIGGMGESTGFQIIGYWLIGGRHIVNKVRPVNKPADCAGLPDPGYQQPGVSPDIPRARRYRCRDGSVRALPGRFNRSVVDGFEYPLPDLISSRFYEVSEVSVA